MLPQFSNLTTYAQENSVELLLTVLFIAVIVFFVKREIGAIIGGVALVVLLIVCIRDPEGTIIRFGSGIMETVFGGG